MVHLDPPLFLPMTMRQVGLDHGSVHLPVTAIVQSTVPTPRFATSSSAFNAGAPVGLTLSTEEIKFVSLAILELLAFDVQKYRGYITLAMLLFQNEMSWQSVHKSLSYATSLLLTGCVTCTTEVMLIE